MRGRLIEIAAVLVLSLAVLVPQASADPDPTVLQNQIVELYYQGRFAEAFPLAEALIKIREPDIEVHEFEYLQSLNLLALIRMGLEEYQPALELLEGVTAGYERLLGPEALETLESLTSLGICHLTLGNTPLARETFEKCLLSLEPDFGTEHPTTIRAMNGLAEAQLSLGDLPEAKQRFLSVLKAQEDSERLDYPAHISVLLRLGQIHWHLGDYSQTRMYYHRAHGATQNLKAPEFLVVARVLESLGGLYWTIGDPEMAEPLLEEALAIYLETYGEAHRVTATVLNNLALTKKDLGDPKGAKELHLRALRVREEVLGPNHPDTAQSLHNLAHLFRILGELTEGQRLEERALAIREGDGRSEHPDLAYSLTNLAEILRLTGDHLEAEGLLNRAIALREKVLGPLHKETSVSLYHMAFLQFDLERPEEGLGFFRRALIARTKVLDDLLMFATTRQRLAFQESFEPYSLFGTLGAAPDLAQSILRFKGVVLNSIAEDLRIGLDSQDPRVAHQVDQLEELKAKQTQLAMNGSADPSREGLERWKQERTALDKAVENLEAELAVTVSGLGHSRRALSVTAEQVQAALPREAVLVELLRYQHFQGGDQFEERYGAVLLPSSGEPRWVPLGSAKKIDTDIGRLLRALRRPTADKLLSRQLRELHDHLWSPIEEKFPAEVTTVILSPDGELSFLPWATLLTPAHRFLAQEYTLCFVASGRDLLADHADHSAGRVAMFLGNPDFGVEVSSSPNISEIDIEGAEMSPLRSIQPGELRSLSLSPLPGTAREVQELEQLFQERQWQVHAVREKDATEEWVRSAKSPGVLHLATHGFFLPELDFAGPGRGQSTGQAQDHWSSRSFTLANPMHRSGLALAGAETTFAAWARSEIPQAETDGVLSAEEVGALDLEGTWLVALSACETGRGEVRAGEGVMGLRRGFILSGAQNLLLTLWAVDDLETAEFMIAFYRNALIDGDAPRALATTQRDRLVQLRQQRDLWTAVNRAGPFVLTFQGPLTDAGRSSGEE